jgi:two-component sensor histidine kinase
VYAIGPRAQVSLNGCDVHLPPRQLLSVSMILHELLTNAIKYGALATADGRITLEWRPDGDEIWLRWTETFIRDAEKPTRKGFGSKMIDLSVRHELDGRYTFDWRRDGMSFELHFPLGQECAA